MTSQLRVYPTRSATAHAAAAQFVATAEKAINARGRFMVALAGGNTPRDVYRLLASEEYSPMVEWGNVHIFWGDERCVPFNDPENNANMARETLLNHVPVAPNNIYRIQSQLPPEQAAQDYDQTLHRYFSARDMKLPRFDLVLLGTGAEGHTASLFPGSPLLNERERWVAAVYVDKMKTWRITLTPPALNAASKVIFTIIGEEKAPALRQILSDPKDPNLVPAQIVDPPDGQVLWIVDKAAASLVKA